MYWSYRIHTYDDHQALHTIYLPFDMRLKNITFPSNWSRNLSQEIRDSIVELCNTSEREFLFEVRAILVTRGGLELVYLRNLEETAKNYLLYIDLDDRRRWIRKWMMKSGAWIIGLIVLVTVVCYLN